MEYKFIKFDGIVPRGDIKIGVNKSGLIRLSSGFCRNSNAKGFNYAILFYDVTNKVMAIKLTNKKEDGILAVTKDGTAATISGKSFFSVNNINLRNQSGRYDWKKITEKDIGEVYIIELTKK